ncbi:MAG: sulfite exporter TauE/SafE family protein [Sphingomonadales bacterium]|nr:sulfite exporter TauE/SafE family protein [Sphingomonadales bacterium]
MLSQLDGLHALAGLLVGLLVGLTGVGGGSLMTPLLVLLFGVAPQTAVGTDLLYAAITKMTGSLVHGSRETVEWKLVRNLACGSIPATLATLAVLAHVGHIGRSAQTTILVVLAGLLALTALTVLCRDRLLRAAADRSALVPTRHLAIGTMALGAVIGVAVSLSSVGAGAIGVTALVLLYPRLPLVRIVGSDIAHAVPLALVAGIGHWAIGDVDGRLLAHLLIGSIPGVVAGSLLSTRAPDRLLRPLLALVLALSSWQLFLRTLALGPAADPAAITAHPAPVQPQPL